MDVEQASVAGSGGRVRLLAAVGVVCALAAGAGAYFGLRGHGAATGAGGGAGPSARSFAAMAYDAHTGGVVLFGGVGAGGTRLGDTWTWGGRTWMQQHPAHSPAPRGMAAMGYDPGSGDAVLFGGSGGGPAATTQELDDTWLWNGSDWAQAAAAGPGSGALAQPQLATDAASGQLLLTGATYPRRVVIPPCGGGSPCLEPAPAPTSQVWRWTGSGWDPQSATPQVQGPLPARLVSDPVSGHIDAFGAGPAFAGCGVAGSSGGAAGTPIELCPDPVPVVIPPAAPGGALLTPPANDALPPAPTGAAASPPGVMPMCCAGSVSSWDGSAWSAPRAFTRGPNLAVASLAPDPPRHAVIALVDGETWTWDGAAWHRQATSSGPAAPAGVSLAFDAASDRVLAFGGSFPGPADATSDATWAWDGASWALLGGEQPSPPAISAVPKPTRLPAESLRPCPSAAPGAHPGVPIACPLVTPPSGQ